MRGWTGGRGRPGPGDCQGACVAGVGGVAGAAEAVDWVKDEVRVTVLPSARVVVAVRVPCPPDTDVTTLRSMVFPDAVVMTPCLSQVPGASFVSVPE